MNALKGFFLLSVTLLLLTSIASAQSWTNGLVSFYPFNGSANDTVGTNNGTVQNAILTSDRFNDPNSAYYFNGSNSAVDLPPVTFNNLNSGTIANWLFLNRNTQEVVFAKQHDGVNSYGVFTVGFYPNSSGGPTVGNAGRLYFHNQNYATLASSSSLLSTGQWYHVAVTFSSTNCNFYINGVLAGSLSGNFSIPNDTSPTTTSIGSWEEDLGLGQYATLSGKINDVRLFSRALASNEVAQLYASEAVPPGPHAATGTPIIVNGFVVGVNITDGGAGYTNTPLIRVIGTGGSGAQAVAVVSNGVVTTVNINNPGSNYPTNTTVVVFDPPYIFSPVLGIAPMSFLSFSNLTLGGNYQLQQLSAYYWTNLPVNFTASNNTYTQLVAGVAGSGSYRLAIAPVPAQAFATPVVAYGFVVNASITSGGSGYVTSPTVKIVGGNGTNAMAVAQISGGVVTNIMITNPGSGYTNTATVAIVIGQPPAAAVSPAVLPVMRVDAASLAPYDNYQIQFEPTVGSPWGNWNGGLFTPTAVTNSQYLFITNGTGFFRLQYVP
jgi:hypothetical protein